MLQVLQANQSPQPIIRDAAYKAKVRELNDTFRMNGRPACEPYGRKLITDGVRSLGLVAMVQIAQRVMQFNAFNERNDPWDEHDFGAFDFQSERIFWKIDYYARGDMERGSPDPSNPEVTCRVLTVMLASEY